MSIEGKSYVELTTVYFPALDESAYISAEEQYHDWMQFMDMLCSMQIVIKENSFEETFQRIGTVYRDETIMRALEPRPFHSHMGAKREILRIFQTLLDKGEATAREGEILPFDELRMLHELTYPEIMAVILAFLPDLNRKYERIYHILQEERTEAVRPTVGFVYDMCSLFMPMRYEDIALLSDEDSPLGRFVFDRPSGGKDAGSILSKRLCLNQRVREFLMGNPGRMGKLHPYARVLSGEEQPERAICGEERISQVMELLESLAEKEEHGVICLTGEQGNGKKYLIRHLAWESGRGFLSVEVPLLLNLSYRDRLELLEDMVSKCIIEGLLLHLDHVPYSDAQKQTVQEIMSFLQKYVELLFVSTENGKLSETGTDAVWFSIGFERPSATIQKEFWKEFLRERELLEMSEEDLDVIVSKYSLTPRVIGQIADLLRVEGVKKVDEQLLSDRIREKCTVDFGSKAKRLQTGFTWDDIELNEESEQELKKIIAYAKNRAVVYDQYHFDKKLPYGRGFSVLLYGPPGTGKTMAATVLANELKLDIYRIDLSQISSKYIGETEKNLGEIFDIGKNANAILFFDEADSLFTKRTEVSSSNDRHANAEVAYLLQKIEEYDGISFLATNNLNNFDAAFRRRLTYIVPMNLPDARIRQRLWEGVFPEEVPKKKINFAAIAEKAEMSGSNIKAAALQATYQAVMEKRPVSWMDVVDAIDGEYKKNGALSIRQELIRGDFS